MNHVECIVGHAKELFWRASEYRLVFLPMALAILTGLIFDSDFDAKWYAKLRKPRFCPPKWVFPVVWPILYLQIGYSLHMLLRYASPSIMAPQLAALALNLALNYSWSIFFFRRHEIKSALCISAGIFLTGVGAAWLFWQVNQRAAMWLVPYCIWVLFATMLNYRFHVDNKPVKISIPKKMK